MSVDATYELSEVRDTLAALTIKLSAEETARQAGVMAERAIEKLRFELDAAIRNREELRQALVAANAVIELGHSKPAYREYIKSLPAANEALHKSLT